MGNKWNVWSDDIGDVETIEAEAKPNIVGSCGTCGASPTFELVDSDGKVVTQFDLCGVCLFGDSDCVDPENWEGHNG